MTPIQKNYLWQIVRLAGIALLAVGFAHPLVLAQSQPSFTGIWQRNEEESDDPQEKMQAAYEAMRQESGGRRPGGKPGGMGGRSGGGQRPEGGRGSRGGQRPGGQGGLGAFADMTRQIETTLENNEFHVAPSGEGRVRIFYLDGKKHAQETPQGAKMETVAEKKGDRIVVEQKMDQGEITTTYELAPDGSLMIVTVQFEGRGTKEPILIRSVYDAIDEPVS